MGMYNKNFILFIALFSIPRTVLGMYILNEYTRTYIGYRPWLQKAPTLVEDENVK